MRPFMFNELAGVAVPVSVSLDTVTAYGEYDNPVPGTGPFSQTVVTNAVNATASGGTAPYTYSWSRQSGDSTITATTPTAAGTTFQASVARNIAKNAVFAVLVLDSLGAPAFSALVSVRVVYQYDSGM
jgi:hypothetical protein